MDGQRRGMAPATLPNRTGGSSLSTSTSALKSGGSRTQQPVQPASKSEVNYKRFESSRRLVSGHMVYEETEEFERVTYPAPGNPRTRRAVRFAPSPTSTDFDLRTEIETGSRAGPPASSSLSIMKSTAPQSRSRAYLNPLSSTLLPSAHRDRAPASALPPSPPHSYLPPYPPSRLDLYRPHTAKYSSEYVARASANYNSHWDPVPEPNYLSAAHVVRRRSSATHIGHSDLMRAEAERLSACLTHRPGRPPQPNRPTSDFFLFSAEHSIPGFQIVRELGRIRTRIMTLERAQEMVRCECETEERMRGANAVIGFHCEHVDRARRLVRVTGLAVEICPQAPRTKLMHDFDE